MKIDRWGLATVGHWLVLLVTLGLVPSAAGQTTSSGQRCALLLVWYGCLSDWPFVLVRVVGAAPLWLPTEGYASLLPNIVYNDCLCHQTGYYHAYQWAYKTWDGGHTIELENEDTEGHTCTCLVLYLSGMGTRTSHYSYGTHVLFALRLGVEQWTGTYALGTGSLGSGVEQWTGTWS